MRFQTGRRAEGQLELWIAPVTSCPGLALCVCELCVSPGPGNVRNAEVGLGSVQGQELGSMMLMRMCCDSILQFLLEFAAICASCAVRNWWNMEAFSPFPPQ